MSKHASGRVRLAVLVMIATPLFFSTNLIFGRGVVDGVVAFVGGAVQFLWPTFRLRVDRLYISSWYLVGGFTFTALAYTMGNTAPLHYPGTQGAAFSGLWIHDAVGLFAAPMALAAIARFLGGLVEAALHGHGAPPVPTGEGR